MCCSLIWLYSDIALSEELYKYASSIFRYLGTSFQVLVNKVPLLELLQLCLFWLYEGSSSYILVVFKNFLVFYFPFSTSSHNNSAFLFSEISSNCCSIFGVITCKLWVYHGLNVFKLTVMVYCNRISLIILINDAKYIHILPIILTCLSPVILQVWAIYKFTLTLLISQQILINLFVNNILLFHYSVLKNLDKHIIQY